MSVIRRILLSTVVLIYISHMVQAGVHGHSGVVLHVDKYGHLSGHSTHYDYRFYPEKTLLAPYPLIDHHNIIGHHHHFDDDHHEALHLIDDEYHGSEPFFYYIHHKDHYDHHSYLHHH